jgi:trehalose 6-phosphate phosphatase
LDETAPLLGGTVGWDVGVSATRDILAKANAAALEQFVKANVLLAFDFDGTLSPIATAPSKARMRRRTRALLTEVARRYPCAVISGRRLADIQQRIRPVPVQHLFGNHGGESLSARPSAPVPREWLTTLSRDLACVDGVTIENKRWSVTVHYRHAADRRLARAAIADSIRRLNRARRLDGIESINILPAGNPTKGDALRIALQQSGCTSAVFIGDDVTDEHAFAALPRTRTLPVRVGRRRQSAARYYVASQRQVDDLLARLLALRADRGNVVMRAR